MTKDLKIFAIDNVTFKKPLSSKKAFKKYKKERDKLCIENWRNAIKEHPHLDLIENGSPIGNISNLVTIGTFLTHKLTNGDKNDNK